MNIDDIVKLILVISVSFAIVGIAFQLMRLLGEAVSILEDLRHPLKNIAEFSDMLIDDYQSLRDNLSSVGKGISTLGTFMDDPLKLVLKAYTYIHKFFKRSTDSEE